MFKNKTILITGGTGSFGNAVLERFLNTDISEIRISNTNRSAEWVDATYHTLMTPTSFAQVTDVFTTTTTQ
jgi:FlaA1/EpsC-like NDP-sugar epimerase